MHGAEILQAPRGGGYAGAGDVLTTTERGVPLAIFTADCLAITLWDTIARVLAVAHVGWRGTVKGVTAAAVRAAVDAGARADQLHVAIAPSIGPCCYEIDEPVLQAFGRAYGRRAQAWLEPARDAQAMLDLWTANEALLADAGVDPRPAIPSCSTPTARATAAVSSPSPHCRRRGPTDDVAAGRRGPPVVALSGEVDARRAPRRARRGRPRRRR